MMRTRPPTLLPHRIIHNLPRPRQNRRNQPLHRPRTRLHERLHHPSETLDAHPQLLRIVSPRGIPRVDLPKEVHFEPLGVVGHHLQVVEVGRRACHAEEGPSPHRLGGLLAGVPDLGAGACRRSLYAPQALAGGRSREGEGRLSQSGLAVQKSFPGLDQTGAQFGTAGENLQQHPAEHVHADIRRGRRRHRVPRGERPQRRPPRREQTLLHQIRLQRTSRRGSIVVCVPDRHLRERRIVGKVGVDEGALHSRQEEASFEGGVVAADFCGHLVERRVGREYLDVVLLVRFVVRVHDLLAGGGRRRQQGGFLRAFMAVGLLHLF
mmetsp:Transcript_20184/g.37039  ORF Transcript_20184/g.37039 Transcript_20184/m.37039 type:complete len:322 (-) Transcript_20184:232-1197(-)